MIVELWSLCGKGKSSTLLLSWLEKHLIIYLKTLGPGTPGSIPERCTPPTVSCVGPGSCRLACLSWVAEQEHTSYAPRPAIHLVSAPTHCGPNKVLQSLLLYCFSTFLVSTVTASVHTNMAAWPVRIIPSRLNYSFLFCALVTKLQSLCCPLQPSFSLEVLLFLVYIFVE